jgi:hypothetical protein
MAEFDAKCFMAHYHAPDQPCWGKLSHLTDAFYDGEGGDYAVRIPACEGHAPVYDDEPYRPQPVKEERT